MTKNLAGFFEGALVGLLGGLAIGISDADWLRMVLLSAILAYAGKTLLGVKTTSVIHSYKIAFTGFACFLAVIAGLYINEQKLFRESPQQAVSHLVKAGTTPEQAREIYVKQILPGH
jgi:hypothetical protein